MLRNEMMAKGNPRCRVSYFSVGSDQFVVASFPVPSQRIEGLTAAERELLGGLLRGQSERELARGRARSLATIRHRVESIYRKTGVRSRAELVAFCLRDSGVHR
jgi:DNA-binding NarL/FixJ family response regulator